MSESTLALERFAKFSGVAPRVLNRMCECGHREARTHLLDWRGQRAACGAPVQGWAGLIRCPCNAFKAARGAL
jgi:hypothetical protein